MTDHTTDEGGIDTAPIFSQSQPDDFALAIGFDNDGDDNTNPNASFDLYGKVDVQHGLFVSRVGAAKTFFHRVEPPKKVSFHLNPAASEVSKAIEKFHYLPVTSKVSGSGSSSRVSVFGKVKALIRGKFPTMRRPPSPQHQRSETTVSELLQIVSLLLAPKEVVIEQEEMVRKKVKPGRWGCDGGCSSSWHLGLPGKGSKGISSMFLSGKWAFLTSALAAIRAPGPCNHF